MRPWAHNDLVITGPPSDPAGIKGMKDGAEALRRITEQEAYFVDFRANGPREVCHKLWGKARIFPEGQWFLKDESGGHVDIATFAESHNAYVVVGRMPILFNKLRSKNMEIMVEGDPDMRRPYIVMEANPEKFPNANHAGARALSDFLVSDKVQEFLAEFGAAEYGGIPLFHPLKAEHRR
jgi:tungstate transport system substrate-binding protein